MSDLNFDSPYVALMLIAGLLSLALTLFAWRRRGAPGATPLVVIGLSAALWQFGYALELASESKSAMVFWAKAEYPAIVAIPVAWLGVTLQYTGRGAWLNLRNLVILSVVPVATVILAWTNESHGLIWSSTTVESSASLSVIVFGHGAAFWAHTIYAYLLIVAGIIFLADALLHSPRIYWVQAAALLVSVLAPWIANWSYTAAMTVSPPVDPTPMAFVVSVAVLAWALYRVQLFGIAPVARRVVFENMDTGVLVLDTLDRVADCNAAAQRIIGTTDVKAIGRPVSEVWPRALDLIRKPEIGSVWHEDLTLSRDGADRNYEATVSSFDDARGKSAGRLIVLHDITERKTSENELRLLKQRLEEVQEAERRYIAQELHDEIGQDLTGLKYLLESIQDTYDESSSKMEVIGDLVEGLTQKVRDLSISLRPSVLDDLGLLPALLWMTRRYTQQSGITVDFEHRGIGERLSPEIESATYRIVQEGLTNVARHASTREATLALLSDNGALEVEIRDHGVGFDTSNNSRGNSSGLGLIGMRERVETLGGSLTIDSAPGSGVKLKAEIPLNNHKQTPSP